MQSLLRWCLVAVMLLWLPRIGWSASFDCTKAQTDTEWAICATPELSSQDDKLAATYRKLLANAASPSLKSQAEHLQMSWLHGWRDLCGGNVSCLTSAYQEILQALQNLPYNDSASAQKQAQVSIVPRCDDAADPMRASAMDKPFAEAVCSDPALLDAVRQVEAQARQLQPRLPPAWRVTFDQQEAAFPGLAQQCPPTGKALQQCIATAVRERAQDLADLASNLQMRLPDCKPGDFSLRDSGVGDAGMSKLLNTYLLEYKGATRCQIRGYPSIQVSTADGRAKPDMAIYSASAYYVAAGTGAPLPIVFSPANRRAWFGIQTATACDDVPGGYQVRVALPLSQAWLGSLKFPQANCAVVVTPVGMISSLRASVR